jgi:hypothetical protein
VILNQIGAFSYVLPKFELSEYFVHCESGQEAKRKTKDNISDKDGWV